MKHRPEIDGLRALAILPVVFYHAGLPGFSGGFVGVDVFFVISGYLITSIILYEKSEGCFSLLSFYERRIRRIFPALFVMMAAIYPVAFLLLTPSAMREFSASAAASTVFVANVFFLGATGYFATAAELKPLLHNWSLSVEEQFYLLFPLLLLLTWRFGRRTQIILIAAVALMSLAFAEWQVSTGEAQRAFFLLHTRVWELLAGALLAYWLSGGRGEALRLEGRFRHAALVGLALMLAAVVTFDNETPFPGLAALIPSTGAALVIAFAAPRDIVGKLLAARPIVLIGLVSYSLYLWHYPMLSFTRIVTGTANYGLLLAVCGLSAVLAWLSWRYIEKPVRGMRSWPRWKVFGTAALAMALVGGLPLVVFDSEAYREYYVHNRLDAATRANYERFEPQIWRQVIADEGCAIATRKIGGEFEAKFEDCVRRHGKAILIFGDSHADNIYRSLRAHGGVPFIVAVWRGGCRPYHPRPECPYGALETFLSKHAGSISKLVFHMSGSHFILDPLGRPDSAAAFATTDAAHFGEKSIRATIAYLSKLPKGPELIWLGPFAEARVDLQDPANFSPGKLRFNAVSLELFARLDRLIASEVEKAPWIDYRSLIGSMKLDQHSLVIGNCITFSDTDHLSSCGEVLFAPAIAAALK